MRYHWPVWSRFEFDSWQVHYRRTRRWLIGCALLPIGPEYSMDEQIDYVLTFFQATYHLRDYLLAEQVVTKKQVDDLMANTSALRVCRDICLGAKHRKINHPSVDSEPWIIREYSPGMGWPADWHLIVKAGEIYDLISLAHECIRAWDSFLIEHELDPSGISPLTAKLATALRKEQVT
jgi:hypothetical protein